MMEKTPTVENVCSRGRHHKMATVLDCRAHAPQQRGLTFWIVIFGTMGLAVASLVFAAVTASARPRTSSGDRVSLDDKVKKLLETKGKVVDQRPRLPCMGVFRESGFCKEEFIVSNVKMQKPDEQQDNMQFREKGEEQPPSNPRPFKAVRYNCEPKGSDPNDKGNEFSISGKKTYSVQVSRTITQQYSLLTGGSLQVSGGIPNIASLTGQVTIQGTTTTIDATQKQTTETDEVGTNDKLFVKPLTRLEVDATFTKTKFTVPYTVNFVLDADIWASDHDGRDENHPKWSKLSQAFSSPAQRSFVMNGKAEVTEEDRSDLFPDSTPFATVDQCKKERNKERNKVAGVL
jgi:hypothetical protein